jgi:hypothetical protein
MEKVPHTIKLHRTWLGPTDAKTDLNYRAGYLAVGMDQVATILIISIETFIYCIS